MKTYIVLLRAVNVGGTGKIKMAALRDLCEASGFVDVETLIASGNLVLDSHLKPGSIKKKLETALAENLGLETSVYVYTIEAFARIVEMSPFQQAEPSQAVVAFLGYSLDTLDKNWVETAKHRSNEEIAAGEEVIYIHYPDGISQSKLRVPAADTGTTRNMNTVRKLLSKAVNRQ